MDGKQSQPPRAYTVISGWAMMILTQGPPPQMFPDSPTRPRKTHTSLYHSSHVNHSRRTLLEDIPEIPKVTLRSPSLSSAVLPPLPDNWEAIRKNVFSSMIEEINGQDRWKCLPRSPNKLKDDEARAFRFMSQIFKGVQKASLKTTSVVKCTVAGSTTPLSKRSNSSRPDAYLHLSNPTTSNEGRPRVDWEDIILLMEFKKSSGDGSQKDVSIFLLT